MGGGFAFADVCPRLKLYVPQLLVDVDERRRAVRGRLAGAVRSPVQGSHLIRFGTFELDPASGELRNGGRLVRLPPQPFKLLVLLTSSPGRLVTREEIRNVLWDQNTFIDFEQAVNFTVKQVREALKDDAERAMYIQTVPKRGYRFIAPVDAGGPPAIHNPATDGTLTKLLWTNVAELRLEEQRRREEDERRRVEEERRRVRARRFGVIASILAAVVLLAALFFIGK